MAECNGADMEGIMPSRLAEINELKETSRLLEELEEQRETTPLIYRAHPALRDLKPENFESAVISLGLFDRRSWADFNGRTKERDSLKKDVLTAFLADIRKRPENWVKISEKVVGDPIAMTKFYERSPCLNLELSGEIIQSALALDSIFLACLSLFVSSYHLEKIYYLERTFKCLRRESLRAHTFNCLFYDSLKMENQVPLVLIRNVIDIIVQARGEDVPNHTKKRDEVLQIICYDWALNYAVQFPSCQIIEKSLLKFGDYQHLFHCVAEAFWYGAKVHTSDTRIEIEKLSERQPRKGGNLRWMSRVCLQARSLLNYRITRRKEPDEELNEEPDEELNEEPDEEPPTIGVPTMDELEPPTTGVPTIEELHKRGITFEGQTDFFPKFKQKKIARWKATLCLPQIESISDNTEMVWRNLLAFESEFAASKMPFTQYLSFMDELVNTERDVQLLSRARNGVILGSGLGDNQAVATLFNSIMTNVVCDYDERWSSLMHDIDKFYHDPIGRDIAEFEEQYCSKPWLVCSVIAAVVLLILTVIQTYYTMWAYYRPS